MQIFESPTVWLNVAFLQSDGLFYFLQGSQVLARKWVTIAEEWQSSESGVVVDEMIATLLFGMKALQVWERMASGQHYDALNAFQEISWLKDLLVDLSGLKSMKVTCSAGLNFQYLLFHHLLDKVLFDSLSLLTSSSLLLNLKKLDCFCKQ